MNPADQHPPGAAAQSAADVLVAAHEHLVVVLRVHEHPGGELLQVAGAGGLPGLLAGLREDREQDGREDGDDSDHHEQLDEREAAAMRVSERHEGLLLEA
jgi:hypothetical protein